MPTRPSGVPDVPALNPAFGKQCAVVVMGEKEILDGAGIFTWGRSLRGTCASPFGTSSSASAEALSGGHSGRLLVAAFRAERIIQEAECLLRLTERNG